MAAGGVKPRDADAVAFLDAFDVAPDLGDGADTFMAGDEGRAWLHRPVALRRVQIGMANAACRDLDDDPGVGKRRALDIAYIERLSEFPNDGCFHHGSLLFVTDIGGMAASLDNRVSENHENHAKRIGGDLERAKFCCTGRRDCLNTCPFVKARGVGGQGILPSTFNVSWSGEWGFTTLPNAAVLTPRKPSGRPIAREHRHDGRIARQAFGPE